MENKNNGDFITSCLMYLQEDQANALARQNVQLNITNTKPIGNSLSEFDIVGTIGKGATGVVYKVISKINYQVFALKKICIRHLNKERLSKLWKEVDVLKALSHKHIIKYYTSFVEDEHMHIITEHAKFGDLDKKRQISEKEIWEMLWHIVLGMLHLHSHSIIHRDIKSQNILITESKSIKIADLGESKFINLQTIKEKAVGTPIFMAPEIFKRENYDQRADIWALGCVLYQMLSLDYPFYSTTVNELMMQVVYRPHKPVLGILKLCDLLLSKHQEKRPYIDEIIKMFPSSFTLVDVMDQENLRNYEIASYRKKEENSNEKQVVKMDEIFNELKDRILVTKADFFKICRETKRELFNTHSQNVLLNSLQKHKVSSQCSIGRRELNESINDRAKKSRLYLEKLTTKNKEYTIKANLSKLEEDNELISLPTIKLSAPHSQNESKFMTPSTVPSIKNESELPTIIIKDMCQKSESVALKQIFKKKYTVHDLRANFEGI